MPGYLPLNTLFEKYRSGILDKKQLEGQIFQFVLDNYKQFHLFQWKRDDCIDYLCWLYPRISKAIDKYKDIGTSFDAYIGSLVYYSSREYRFRETDHSISEHSWWKEKATELSVRNTEPDYPEPKTAYKPVPNPQQILILLLKSYHFMSDDFLSRAAPAIGIETEKLRGMVDELRILRLDKEEQIQGLKERIHCQFYRCISFERRMLAAPEGSIFQKKIQDRLNRARIRLVSMRKRLSIMRFDATNRQIAKVLGIPKGTVDSTLHAAKIKYKPKDKEC
ncbi:hypothetical protein LQZ21_00255 [Treponema sp. TIM-1]|uniref:hypothetical protein n=1 Tax=Treponema sp. TIM-1 TaxID=2898417 RepID=UPI0039810918